MLASSTALRGMLTRTHLPVTRTLLLPSASRAQLSTLRPLHAPAPKGRNWTRVGNIALPDVEMQKILALLLKTRVPASVLHMRRDAATWIPRSRLVRRLLATVVTHMYKRTPPQVDEIKLRNELNRAELRHTNLADGVTCGWNTPLQLPPAGTLVTDETRAAVLAQLKSELPLLFAVDEWFRTDDAHQRHLLALNFTDDTLAIHAVYVVKILRNRIETQVRLLNPLVRPAGWFVSDEQRLAMVRELTDHSLEDAHSALALHAALPPNAIDAVAPGLLPLARDVVEGFTPYSIEAPPRSSWGSLRDMLDTGGKHTSDEFAGALANLSWAATCSGESAAATTYALLAVQMCFTGACPDERTRAQLRAVVDCPLQSPVLHTLPLGPLMSDVSVEAISSLLRCDPDAPFAPEDVVDAKAVDADARILRVLFRLADAFRAEGRLEDASPIHTTAERMRRRLVDYVAKHLQETAE